MKYSELQKTTIELDDNFMPNEVPIGEHVGIYDGATPTTYNSMLMPIARVNTEANRIFKTKEHMLAYIEDRINADGTISDTVTDDTVKSALPGLILTVINDEEDPNNNGMYYIENADPNVTPGLVAKKIGPLSNTEIQQAFDEGTAEVNKQ